MKIIGISASGRLNGNTGRIVRAMLDKLSSLGAQSEFIWAGDKKVEPCRACEYCMKHDRCVIEDDYEEIRRKILDADGVILGTPNYAFQMSAQLKAFYDRSHSLLYYTRRLAGKYALGVCVGGHSYMTGKIAKTVAQGIWLCGGYYSGYLPAVSINRDEMLLQNEKQAFSRAENLAGKLYQDIKSQRRYRWQHFLRGRFLYPQVAKMVENNKSKYPFLYEYYKSRGYL